MSGFHHEIFMYVRQPIELFFALLNYNFLIPQSATTGCRTQTKCRNHEISLIHGQVGSN